MMVADANVVFFLLVNNPSFSPDVRAAYAYDSVWYAPAVWRSELRSTLMKYVRHDETKEIPGSELTLGVAIEHADDVEEIIRTGRRSDSEAVLRLAYQSGCSPYDCEYVQLARETNTKLLTYDGPVLEAFPEIAVRPGDFAPGA